MGAYRVTRRALRSKSTVSTALALSSAFITCGESPFFIFSVNMNANTMLNERLSLARRNNHKVKKIIKICIPSKASKNTNVEKYTPASPEIN